MRSSEITLPRTSVNKGSRRSQAPKEPDPRLTSNYYIRIDRRTLVTRALVPSSWKTSSVLNSVPWCLKRFHRVMSSSAGGAGPFRGALRCGSSLPPFSLSGGRERVCVCSGWLTLVADPGGLGGEQVAVLRLHVASVVLRNRRSILLSERSVYTPWHKTHRDTKGVQNF